MKNVLNGQELEFAARDQNSCHSIVENLVGHVDSNHVSLKKYIFSFGIRFKLILIFFSASNSMDQVVNGKQYTTDNHKAFSKNKFIQMKSVIKYLPYLR